MSRLGCLRYFAKVIIEVENRRALIRAGLDHKRERKFSFQDALMERRYRP